MFSSRLPGRLEPNTLSRLVDARRRSGPPFADLTASNPTAAGISYPRDILSSLASPRALIYDPDPRGLLDARTAIAADYARRGVVVDPGRLILTSSTSEAYAWLFKTLCDPDDDVLVPQPSYPLFDLLASLEAVTLRPYRLEWHGAWSIDRATVEAALTPRTRAILVVTPNNPTGSMLREDDREWIVDLCRARSIAIVSDEVFADYPIAPRPDASSFAGEQRALTFVLGGLSKSVGLPQVKLAWILVGGHAHAAEAIARLEIVADTYLSVSTPVQHAAASLLADGAVVRGAILERLAANLAELRRAVASFPAIALREPEGGWTAMLEAPSFESEEALVLRLLDTAGVLVHPGYFFDFPAETMLVVSLLPLPAVFADAVARMLRVAAGPAR
jgi:aspartate/methionine/tyrosine aminotransferase